MSYQLVIQFRGDSLEDFDALVALEEALIEQLQETADVDGHDIGSGETNLFIYTRNPVDTFSTVQPILAHANLLAHATVAYRPVDGEEYTVVWPLHSTGTFKVT